MAKIAEFSMKSSVSKLPKLIGGEIRMQNV